MSETVCLSCGASTSNGLALCDLCQYKSATILEFLPIYFKNLARWRPGRAGSRPVPGSTVLYYGGVVKQGTGDQISDSLNECGNALSTWARALADDRGIELPDGEDEPAVFAATCVLIAQNLTSIATLEWAGELVNDLVEHEDQLRILTETYVPGWYAGGCKRRVTMEETCGAATYVVPGLTWVKCQTCGTTTYARDHLETILDEARSWVAPPKRLAEAIVALVDTELSIPRLHDRIRQWEHRNKKAGKSLAIRKLDDDGDPVGPKRYRLGDALSLILSEGPTRLDDGTAEDTVVAV